MGIASFEEFSRGCREHQRFPLIAETSCDDETPVSLFARWQREKYAFLLESLEGGEKWGRYSFIGLYPSQIFRSSGEPKPLEELRRLLSRPAPLPLPRFAGGLVGFASYDAVRFFETLPSRTRNDLKIPDFYFIMPQVILSLDNLKHSLQILCYPEPVGSLRSQYREGRRLIETVLAKLKKLPRRPAKQTPRKPIRWKASLTRAEYVKRVKRIQEYIQAGDVTQAVLSIRFSATAKRDPFQIYRQLRQINPSPYLFYLKMNEFQIVGASPETMVRLEGGEMIVRPIAGTRPRGRNEAEDRRLEQELLADPKERAEHIMLVDLGRNDLGRVAQPGTVKVDQLMGIERYSHVMHIVSNVRAQLEPGKDAFDLLKAAFPAGTLTGSPKIRAMEIIEELEPVRRGAYGGCVGYFSLNGDMDMAITIRSALFHQGKIHLQAGAGIVADSVPEREYEECLNKAKGMMVAMEGM